MNKFIMYLLCFFIGFLLSRMIGDGFSVGGQNKLCKPFDERSKLSPMMKCSYAKNDDEGIPIDNYLCRYKDRALKLNCGQYCGCIKEFPDTDSTDINPFYNEVSWHNEKNKTGHSCITSIRDQGQDVRCNIHSLMAATETYIYISKFDKKNFDYTVPYENRPKWTSPDSNHLSVQYLINYSHSYIAGKRKGGGNNLWLSEFLKIEEPIIDKYKIYSKLFLEKDIPYDIAERSNKKEIQNIKEIPLNIKLIGCSYFRKDNSFKIEDVHKLLKKHLEAYGPIVTGIDSRYLIEWSKDKKHKKFDDEIIYNPYDSVNWDVKTIKPHAVCLIGFGNNEYGEYWIIKNSWGEGGGIMKIHIDAINQSINHPSDLLKKNMKTEIHYNFSFPIIELNGTIYPEISINDQGYIENYIDWNIPIKKELKAEYCNEHKKQSICTSN